MKRSKNVGQIKVTEDQCDDMSFALKSDNSIDYFPDAFADVSENIETSGVIGRHKVVSYFAGCGGMDLGFHGGFEVFGATVPELDFEIEKAYDFDERCVETYKQNISDRIEHVDLSNFDPKNAPRADVLIGGFPCQDFSSCGPKRGLTSSRGQLYRSLIDYMMHHKPKVVIGENVPHLARMQKGQVLKTILEDLSSTGYKVELWNLYAPDYGIPQNRRRLFFVCVHPDLDGFPEQPAPEFGRDDGGYRSISWAIDDLKHTLDESVPNQSQYFLASKAKKGNGQGDEKSKRDQPAYTVRANAKSRVQFHYSLERRLTVRECARLQTFPDDFAFPHSATTNVMQIGNAVPPVLAHKVAEAVSNFLKASKI
ncbi:DNA (cytosine-5-)-methyltransferase [Novosphingobium sp. FGD1]|uniref:Cytosine-specific methyltransferase n=1 Tax=Novosphingobium silvae TaxID=2692619 RepID=A0A7X4GKD2_9SPHN|nr:DNA (cytosine-5-)-methyltransferase [Novosphingobium silvae]MYM00287.1 DNA (cytosine-5-)-methyltransferase [Novosphingobium silvae]